MSNQPKRAPISQEDPDRPLKPDEGYDPVEWRRIAARGRWGGSVESETFKRWRNDVYFRQRCDAAYIKNPPPLDDIVETIVAALIPYETARRERMLRIANEFPDSGAMFPDEVDEETGDVFQGFKETPREAAIKALVQNAADWDQRYGMRRSEIEIALCHRWPGITKQDIDDALAEGIERNRIYTVEFKAKEWSTPETVHRARINQAVPPTPSIETHAGEKGASVALPESESGSNPPLTPRVLSPTRHGRDFRSVVWNNVNYSFTAAQSHCVRDLWIAWKNGTPDVGDETLVEVSGSAMSNPKLAYIFRDNPAWGTMIVEGSTKGTHRLAEPGKSD